MNNLRFSSGYPAIAIMEELAPNPREEKEEFKELSDTFQQGLRLCSPRLQVSMDDYSINYHCSLAIQQSSRYGMSSGVDRKPKRSSSLGSACGLVTPKRSSSLPPTLRRLFGFEGGVVPILASPIIDFNRGTPHKALSNLLNPRTDFSTDDTDGSWTAGLQLVSYEDGSTMTKMSGTQIEHFNSGDEMSPNNVSHSSVPTISNDFDRVPSSPLANEKTNERASLLDEFPIVVSPHLDNSVTSIEEQRRDAKMARALEMPFEYGLQNRMMTEYEEQLTPMENDNGFDFISLSPTFSPTSMETIDWEKSLVFQFENLVQLGVTSEASPQFPVLGYHGDDLAMIEMPSNEFRIPKQVNIESDTVANAGSSPSLSIRLVNFQQTGFKDSSFANGTVNGHGSLSEDYPAKASLDLQHSACSIQERRRAAKAARALEEPFQYNLQNMIMAEYELQISPMDFSYEHASNFFTPTFMLHSSEVGNQKEQLNFQFPIQSQLEDSGDSNPTKGLAQQLKKISQKSKVAVTPNLDEFYIRDSKPTAAESDEQFSFTSIHARRLAARIVRQKERENEFNGQNRVMYEYEQMEPIDITDDNNYLCPSPIYQGSQTVELEILSDSEVPESMNSFSSLTLSSSLTMESPYGNGDNNLPDGSPTYEFDALTSLEDQLRFMNLAKNDETEQVYFDEQRFVMMEYEISEPMDVSNGMSYECSSPTFATSSPASDIISRLFNSQDFMDTKPTDNSQCGSCCESVKDPEHSTHPLLPSIGYSAQSLDQYGRNRDEQLDDGREESPSQHFDNGFSDGWSRCAKGSGACRNSPRMDQSYHEEVADPTGREVSPTRQKGEFQEPTLSGLLGSQHFSDVLVTSCSFDDEYENDDDNEVFTEFNDQHLCSTQMEGGEDERFPHSQSSGLASSTRSSSEVDVFGSAPSAIERRVMSEFPGCSMEHARGMLERRLHDKVARQLDSVDTCNQEETVMMEFEAGLGSGVCDDEDDGFSGEVAIDLDNHEEDWTDETGRVCEADIPIFPQSSFVYPPDSGGR